MGKDLSKMTLEELWALFPIFLSVFATYSLLILSWRAKNSFGPFVSILKTLGFSEQRMHEPFQQTRMPRPARAQWHKQIK